MGRCMLRMTAPPRFSTVTGSQAADSESEYEVSTSAHSNGKYHSCKLHEVAVAPAENPRAHRHDPPSATLPRVTNRECCDRSSIALGLTNYIS
jgi:hypothetical protein